MKAITIHQPWASLIAIEAKRFETRGWKTNYRGPIAIHAGKQIDHKAALMIARDYPQIWRQISPLPTGSVVATAELRECYEVYEDTFGDIALMLGRVPQWMIGKDSQEFLFGYYASGRYAWELANVRRIEPFPAKGQQGLWNWDNPAGE